MTTVASRPVCRAGLAAGLAFLSGCVPNYTEHRPMPGVDGPAPAPATLTTAAPSAAAGTGHAGAASAPGPGGAVNGTSPSATAILEDETRRFALAVVQARPKGEVGCLPLQGHDLNRDAGGAYVPDLGERLADDLANALVAAGLDGRALAPTAMQLRLAEANVSRFLLDDLATLTDLSGRLGLDLITFGSIRREDGFGPGSGTTLRLELSAFDVRRGQVVANRRFEIAGSTPLAAVVWEQFRREAPWAPEGPWASADTTQSLDEEIKVLSRQLADEFMRQVDAGRIAGIVYIAPADAGSFVRSVAELRAAQVAFGREYERRENRASTAGEPLDEVSPVSLGSLQFESLQDAESFLIERRETLMATRGARLCQSVSSMLAEQVRPRLVPYEVRVNDIGFTKWSDTQLVEGELATGGLTRSLKARNDMRAAGITLAVQPMIERWGDGFRLRIEAYDLAASGIAASASAAVAPEFREQFSAALGDLMEAGGDSDN